MMVTGRDISGCDAGTRLLVLAAIHAYRHRRSGLLGPPLLSLPQRAWPDHGSAFLAFWRSRYRRSDSLVNREMARGFSAVLGLLWNFAMVFLMNCARMVVIPMMLTSIEAIEELVERLEVHHLGEFGR